MNMHNNTLILPLIIAASVSLSACNGGGGAGDSQQTVNTADFDGEVYNAKTWDNVSPLQTPSDQPTGNIETLNEEVDSYGYSCTLEEHSLTENPAEFIAIDPDKSVLWVGALIQGRSHYNVGSLDELPIRERGPIDISIDLLRADNYRHIDTASQGAVNSAIGELVDNAVQAGHEASSDVYFESREAHSSSQTSLNLGFSAEYLGGSLEGRLEVDKQGEEHTYFAYFIQKAFTVNMQLPTAPHDMVNDSFTEEQLQALRDRDMISDENMPLYISSMSYGRVLVYKFTSSHSRERIKAAMSFSYDGVAVSGSGYTEAELLNTLSTARIEIAAYGGNQSNIESLIRSGRLSDYFVEDTRLTSMKPISFEIRNLQDNTTARISRTTEYKVKQCSYTGRTIPAIGERVKVLFDSVYIPTDCDGGINQGDIYGRFDVITYDGPNGGQITRRITTIDRGSNIKVQSGNTLSLTGSRFANDKEIVVNRYYGKDFRISATLRDADGGSLGADDIVGNWNANSFNISGLVPGTYTRTAVSNCSGNNPRMTYRIQRVEYIYPY